MAAGKQKLIVGAFTISIEPNDSTGGFRFRAETIGDPSGPTARFLEIEDGGGHLVLNAPGSCPSGTGLELDGTGHAIFNLV